MSFQYPLKLISPSPTFYQRSVLVFLLTYGGGLVGGDQVYLQIDVKPSAKLSIVTQGHTKIFKSSTPNTVTRQQLRVVVENEGAVCLLPDPVQPFEGSVYEQSQIFTLNKNSSLCLLDWVSAGRTARGEDWDLHAWSGRNEIWSVELPDQRARLLLRDNVLLKGDAMESDEKLLKTRMQGLGIFGTLVLRGPLVQSLAEFFLAEFDALPRIGSRDFRSQATINKESGIALSQQEIWRKARLRQEKEDGVLWSAAKIRGCTIIKFGSRSVEGGRMWVGSVIREEGSIEKHFGDDAIMCIR
jgi:urease accessory protein